MLLIIKPGWWYNEKNIFIKFISILFFRFYNGAPLGKTVNFSGQYAHTYESTNLTGISIGATSFGGSFSVKNKGWKVDNYSFKKF